jgi:hypothetical protein
MLMASAGASLLQSKRALAQDAAPASTTGTIYLLPDKGSDTNPGTKDSPLKTLAAAAKRVNESTGTDAATIILSEGVYAVGETAVFKPANRFFSKERRLTIRAEVLPDDPNWHTGRMPTLIHTMPLSPDWNGRPDPFGGVAYGMMIETSHVTIQGLKILGMPVVEQPKRGAIHRVYPIGRNGRDLDDLEIKQCLFAGDRKFTGSGGGPALNFRDTDPSFLELVGTKKSDEPLELEMDQSKRNYLHPKEGTEAAKIGAGIFINKP